MKTSLRFTHKILIVLFSTAILVFANFMLNSPNGYAADAQVSSSADASSSWAGYVDTGKTFSKVQGEITVPTITCVGSSAESLFWVGIDGYNEKTVEQDGVGAKCIGATPTYFAWWEMYTPTSGPLMQISASTLSVKPGQKIDASVSYVTLKTVNDKLYDAYSLQLDNVTTNQKPFVTNQTCTVGYSCNRGTVEWVAERYNVGNNTFASLGKWSYNAHLFENAYVASSTSSKLEPISGYNNIDLSMIDSDYNFIAQPGVLNTDGTSFGVTWYANQ